MSARVAARPAATPASGPSNGWASCTTRTPAGTRGHGSGRHDDPDLARQPPAGIDRVVEQGPAVEGFGELVPAEPRRATAGQDDDGDRVLRGHRGPTPAAARGPGTWPASVRRRTPRRSRSSRMAMTNFRLVPVASRKAAGVRGPAPAIAVARAASSPIGRCRVGEIRLEDDDPAAALEFADTGRRTGRRSRSRGEGRRRRDRQRSLEAVHRGQQGRVRRGGRSAGESQAVAGTDQATGPDQRIEDGRGTRGRVLSGQFRRAPDRPRDGGSGRCERRLGALRARHAVQRGGLRRLGHIDREPHRAAGDDRAVKVESRGPNGRRVAGRDRFGEARHPLDRLAATRDAPGRIDVQHCPADDRIRAARPAKHEVVARGDGDRARQAAGSPSPSHRADRSRRARYGRPRHPRTRCRDGVAPASGRVPGVPGGQADASWRRPPRPSSTRDRDGATPRRCRRG